MIRTLLMIINGSFNNHTILSAMDRRPNGVRYRRVGGTRQRHFVGANLEPRNLLENVATPTRRVHAVLGAFDMLV